MKGLVGRFLKPSAAATGEASPESLNGIGWQVGVFAFDRLRPDERSEAGTSAIWQAYCAWCQQKNVVPLAFAVFHAEFEKVAAAAGIDRRQVGAHVHYTNVRIESEAA